MRTGTKLWTNLQFPGKFLPTYTTFAQKQKKGKGFARTNAMNRYTINNSNNIYDVKSILAIWILDILKVISTE